MKLVLLPGLDGTGVLFRPLLAALPAEISAQVIAYPKRLALGYDELFELVREQLPTEPYVLLGESFSGPLSIRLAASAPTMLRGLILAGTFAICPVLGVPKWARHFIPAFPFRAFPFFTYLKTRLAGGARGEHWALAQEAVAQVAPAVFAHRVREVIQVDVENELRECAVPILYLQGEHDLVVPAHNLRRMQRIKPTLRVARISSGHMILQTQPAPAGEAIDRFMRGLESVSS